MALSLFDASVPVFIRMLTNLKGILKKGEEDAQTRNIDDAVFVNARLSPDMFELKRQVRLATDFARGTAARLTGNPPPDDAAEDTTLADLQARIDRALSELKATTAPAFEGAAERVIQRKVGGKDMSFSGIDYLETFAIPNFYFHVTTAYNILRHNGVAVGKRDFIGQVGRPAA